MYLIISKVGIPDHKLKLKQLDVDVSPPASIISLIQGMLLMGSKSTG